MFFRDFRLSWRRYRTGNWRDRTNFKIRAANLGALLLAVFTSYRQDKLPTIVAGALLVSISMANLSFSYARAMPSGDISTPTIIYSGECFAMAAVNFIVVIVTIFVIGGDANFPTFDTLAKILSLYYAFQAVEHLESGFFHFSEVFHLKITESHFRSEFGSETESPASAGTSGEYPISPPEST